MGKNRIVGSGKQIKGRVEEAIGKVASDRKLQARGNVDKMAGKIQKTIGDLSDALKGKWAPDRSALSNVKDTRCSGEQEENKLCTV
jgi:uncharacterized protein YjbJ (UPF0337 family)